MKYIPRCFDSHAHVMATGQVLRGLSLFNLKGIEDLKDLKFEAHHFRGDWLVGFGWNQYLWKEQKLPNKKDLDKDFPHFPVAFTRVDGHATWLNTKALEKIGMTDHPTGIFVDQEKVIVDLQIPEFSLIQKKDFLEVAVKHFNAAGFTHVRDMSGFLDQWNLLVDLDNKKELSIYLEQNFTCEDIKDFDRALRDCQQAKKEQTPHLIARGIKFYFDGALGSEGAMLSKPYANSHKNGHGLWPLADVEEVIIKTWQQNLEVSVHTIGDEACHQVVKKADDLFKRGIHGVLNIEHAEMIRPETVIMLKELSAICHMQPCHWLSDRQWLKEKLGSLYQYAFPWHQLEAAGVSIQWGSDSPIEPSSIFNNLKALKDSVTEGIWPVTADPLIYHSHRDKKWGSKCETTLDSKKVRKVVFDGVTIIENSESEC